MSVLDTGGNVKPEDIFDLLNKNNDASLNLDEFRMLFRKLDLGLSQSQQDRMFAYCDLNVTHTVSREEFSQGWDYIMEEMVNGSLEDLGLGSTQILLIITLIVFTLVLWFVFLFLLISVWNNESSFAATIQSLMIVGSGAVSTQFKTKTDAVAGRKDLLYLLSHQLEIDSEEAAAAEASAESK